MDTYQMDDMLDEHLTWLNSNGGQGVRLNLARASLDFVSFSGRDLRNADLQGASLIQADLGHADLRNANLIATDLTGANLQGADLRGAELGSARLSGADLSAANLGNASLTCATMLGTNLRDADISGCAVYGSSVWNLRVNDRTRQANLVISPSDEPAIVVDDLEVAQFIYLLLNNEKIRNVIDTVGKKAVLLLGRFTNERKPVLDALRDELRRRGFAPILFDFEKPGQRDLSETVSTLAHLARFVIVDLTDARSVPQELQKIVPNLPSLPVQTIIHQSQRSYAMFKDFAGYPSVAAPYRYDDVADLIDKLQQHVIQPAISKLEEIAARRRAFEEQLK
jgi:hypothetical protein